MDKTNFLTIYRTFERLDVVRETLPGIVEETKRNDARLIVQDSSVNGRDEKWDYLLDLNKDDDFFLILSSNMSAAHASNMCLQLGQELYAPEYICIVEDDHGFLPGTISVLTEAMQEYYGKISPNGLRYGLFTGCAIHNPHLNQLLHGGHAYPSAENDVSQMGRANACFRCAPASHWNNVLKGLDTDEYLVSNYQVSSINRRNYFKGFTAMLISTGQLCSFNDSPGRGASDKKGLRRWDATYTASDPRSQYKK
ncbi:MAG: hypothetical protein NT040_03280 [Bacteroidetes bacterium]|nr:hypothetical protein [Bacteroidota bacterium]